MRHAPVLTALVLLLAVALCPARVYAQTTQSDTATFNAAINGLARLSFSSTSVTFADADPDTVPVVTAMPAALTITAKARATEGGTVTLTVMATDDLRSGVDTIPASAISWTATGAGFAAGTLSRTSEQVVGAWSGSGVHTGAQTFRFQNLWTYPTGTYSVTMVFTLSAA